ncbi:MAG: ABC-type lipoprotein release transport system permease subunit [Celeribacter sp.]|jgi:ABC-type lipoprotein release transport system permease subunit
MKTQTCDEEMSTMTKPFSPLVSAARRSFVMLFNALLCIGILSIFFLQMAFAMSKASIMEAQDILMENSSGSIHCAIVTQSVSQSLEMKAVVWSNNMATGSYSFIVTKQGVSGRSNVAQSGVFEVEPSEQKIVGTIMVNATQGDRYLARLSVRSGTDEVMCDTKID